MTKLSEFKSSKDILNDIVDLFIQGQILHVTTFKEVIYHIPPSPFACNVLTDGSIILSFKDIPSLDLAHIKSIEY